MDIDALRGLLTEALTLEQALRDKLSAMTKYVAAPDPQGNTIEVPEGADLQKALDAAPAGATIFLIPGATYGTVKIPVKTGPLAIQSKVAVPRGRVNPVMLADKLPRLGSGLSFAPAAHDVTITGVEIFAGAGETALSIGTSYEKTLDELPDHIALDRVWIHADPTTGAVRGVALNGKTSTLIDSRVEGFWVANRQGQAVAGWTGPGPFNIINCYLEGAGQNFLLGGSDPVIPGVRPGNLTFRFNHCFKPLEWKTLHKGTVANLFELKNCNGATIEDNVFENNWIDVQPGSGVLFTQRNQGGRRPDSNINDIFFRRNTIINVENFAINILGWDNNNPTDEQGCNLTIEHCIARACKSFLNVGRGWDGLTVNHNTSVDLKGTFLTFNGPTDTKNQVKKLIVTNNVFNSGAYGINGDSTGVGIPALDKYAPGYVFKRNVIEKSGVRTIPYPPDNPLLAVGQLIAALTQDLKVLTGGPADVPTTDGLPPGANR